ncbi:MAG: DNA repair protein RecO [Chloroflexi bacterium]|nr:DNA repair protein RecO [Chloroflexota bacterium]
MRAPRVYKTEAIVLKQSKLGEADRIITCYTPYLGKMRGVAKGVRRPGSRLSGHLEPFTHTSLMLAQGQNLDVITQAQTIEGFWPLRQDLRRMSLALYAVELVERFTSEGLENPGLFRLFSAMLHLLGQAEDPESALRFFEVQLLERLGYRPHLDSCLRCGRAPASGGNYFSPSAGGLLCPFCRSEEPIVYPLSVAALQWLRRLQAVDIAEMDSLKIPQPQLKELALRAREYIRYLLEQEIKSAAFVEMLHQEEGRSRAR